MSVVIEETGEQDAGASREEQPAQTSEAEESIVELASRASELEATLKAEKAKSENYFRRLQYLQADFENYRKRVEKEMSDVRRMGNERLLSDLLVVNDELELALQKAKEADENPILVEGVGMIHKRLEGLMAKEGIQRIQSVGSKFDPDFHDAALRVPSDKEEGTVVEEIRSGFLLKGKVLRPSIVKVAEKHAHLEAETKEEAEI